ncbi:amino acid adenylation domain-containing protein [Nannocystis sp. ILAH1]|uniref:non-ribosomal peptide synthetase/type I polyketide synthase n=1 Tax=Nannocystis sp. ILAH1 TaxID=2996789 RepID=UPI00226E8244|nr:amino acid adenylation domain-containing protein [Nannocystis sp. ILAH1]
MPTHDSTPIVLSAALRELAFGRRTDFPRDRSIADVFEEQVRRAPDAIALRFEGQDTSYRELNRRANRLARRLRAHGVGVDAPVGILLDPSPAVVIAFLAIVKAGGAYVPLDLQHPANRLARMIEDTRPTVLLGSRELAARCGFTGDCIEYPGADLDAPTDDGDDVDVRGGAGPEDIAHVLFTSGSTGRPKGASILHRGVLRLVVDTDWIRIGPDDRVAQVGSFSFDIATVEVWGALLNGACLCIIPRNVLLSPALLARTLADERLTFLVLSTPLLHRFASIVPGAFAGLRTLVVGGDVLDPKWARELFAAGKPERLVNIYGPTECTTGSTWFELQAPPELAASIPIGRPIANTTVYLLDERLEPVALGEPGEVWIGGDGVGRGYLNRPELTAERFVRDPFAADPGARLYRTGDRARWLPDGNLEFLGRVDNQVKVRGFRIELGEIEGALRAHAAVGDAIVRVREDVPGDKKLVAYVSPRPGHAVDVTALREHLAQQLPPYMVPQAFVALAELPLNVHGKVDPLKLPAPRFEADARVAPRDALEASLAQIWADVLRLAEVGVHDRFLEHGGDSLLALSVLDRIHREHGVILSARAVFEAATIEGLARAVEAARAAGEATATAPLTPVDRSRPLPLSFAERQLWFVAQMAPDSRSYNEPFTLHLAADTDPELLEQALREVVERHEILRTTYALAADGPVRIVHAALPPTFAREDLRGTPAELREERARELATRDARARFDLERGPLLRATFVRLDDAACRLYLTCHHVVIDGLSMALFLRELEACHAALAAGQRPELAPLSLQYADFAAWQTDEHQLRANAPHLEYWTSQLRGVGTLELPGARPRPATPSHRGARHYLHIPAALAADVKELGRSAGATPFMTFLALYGVLLQRTSGSDDFAIGATFSGRARPELGAVMGMFANLLPIRLRAAADLPFRDLLAAVRAACLEAFEHDAPLPSIIEAVNPERHANMNPLFQASFTLEPALSAPGSAWRMEQFEIDTGAARFDLSFELDERPDGVLVRIEYSTDRFDAWQIEAMAGHYLELLRGATQRPDAPLRQLPLLRGPETAQLLAWSRGPRVDAPAEALHRLFEQQASRTPDAPAAVFEERSLTYRELNAAANRLARHLRDVGVGVGDMVGICIERSLDMVVGVLAILKAGAAYVPLDASYPPARLAFILADTSIRWIVGETSTRELVAGSGATFLCLDELRDVLAAAPGDDLDVAVAADDLAYVIYTSGSTGTPKGALIEHRSAYHFCRSVAAPLGFGPGLRVLQFARLGFDASVIEIFVTLASGGTVHLAHQRDLIPGFELAELLARRRIGLVCLPPSALAMVPARALPELRVLIAAGEDCPQALVDAWAPGRSFFNVYGPTETTVLATIAECVAGRKPPIGRPIAGADTYVLDAALQLVPAGVPGELYIGGTGLSRGYLRRPELQAERFVAVPVAGGATLYKTGDRVRLLPGGELEFLGRLDHQVKLRGFRIELGEIEAALRQHPGVRDAAVVVQSIAGDRRLVGYVAAPAGAREDLPRSLKERLRGRLPDYMVPAEIVVMDALPLGPNDKLDRKALPLPERWGRPAAERPAKGTQEVLADIWRRVLGIAEVGLRDGFFDLGGSSLLLARVQAEIAAALGVRPSMATLFQFPTLEALARHLGGEVRPARDERPVERAAAPRPGGIAIIGMAGRFPGAGDVDALWTLLVEGKEGVTRTDEPADDPAYVRAAGLLAGADEFDAEFFGYTPKDARLTDPQQRLFLECAWEALERAGYDAQRVGKTGVFAGSGVPRYWLEQVALQGGGAPTAAWYQAILGNPWQFLATTTAYKLGLRGPALTVQTACSTSLVAVHMACQSLLTGECDVALAGGVSLATLGEAGYVYEEGSILSPDGRCRPFDARAQGTVPASGVGVVVLKRLERALADGDTIHAVIRGSAINNDGADKIGFTAPSVQGQRDVIAAAHAAAGVRPHDIGFVEAHGTATPLGDPIEVQALRLAFGAAPCEAPYCALGSLKSNLGHLDAAAGVAGLIKAALAIEHAYLPGTLHFERENPELQLAGSPFYVRREGAPWLTPAGVVRRAGVSSFGIGGTNAHVILEQAPAARAPAHASEPALLVLSTRREDGIDAASRRLADHLADHPTQSLADVAFTLQQGRAALAHRRAVVCRSVDEARRALAAPAPLRRARPRAPEVVFLFPGGGSQRVGMGAGLYRSEPVYRDAIDRCAALFARELGGDLRALLFPPAQDRDAAAAQLRLPSWNMASVFATEYALSQLLAAWGVRPAAMIGHSLGEYTAACLAGILALEDAAALVALRGRLCDSMPASAMLVVPLPPTELAPLLGDGLALAAVNGPKHVVVSGLARAIDDLEEQLRGRGVQTHRLQLAGGFHSPLVEPAMAPLTARAAAMRLHAPTLPVVSNVTADWLRDDDARDPSYWARHLRQTVRFSEGLARVLQDPGRILLEVGPGKSLATLAQLHPDAGPQSVIVSALGDRTADDDRAALLEAIGELWCAGVEIDWTALHGSAPRRRVPLPTYPFARQRHMLDRAPARRPEPVVHLPRPVLAAEAPEPAPATERVLAALWEELLGVDAAQLAAGSDFFDLGGTSLLAVQMIRAVKDRLRVPLTAHAILEHRTLGALARVVDEARPQSTRRAASPLLIRLQVGAPGHTPLILVQPIGGTVYTYMALARELGAERPVYAFRALGLEDGEVPEGSVPEMARRYVEELLELQPEGPYLLGGHSSGGVIAYEIAGQLLARGHVVERVIQVDTVTVEQSHRLGVRDMHDAIQLVESFKAISSELATSLLVAMRSDPRLGEVILATNKALALYQPARHAVPLVYLRASERDPVLDPHADAWWRAQTAGGFEAHDVPGNHFSVMEDPHVAAVARVLRERLDPGRPEVAPLRGVA